MERAVILCDGYFGQNTGKTANGLVRYSKRYEIVGVIDHTKAGRDAGEVLDGRPKGIPIVGGLREAIDRCSPKTLIIGVATFGGYIPQEYRPTLREAIEHGLNTLFVIHTHRGGLQSRVLLRPPALPVLQQITQEDLAMATDTLVQNLVLAQ